MPEIKYEVVKPIGVLSETGNGWKKEINLVSWNEREPIYDIRTWSEDRERMGKGITLSPAEIKELKTLLNSIEID
jgi:hypothetical protein